VCKLRISLNGLPILAVRHDVIDGTVLEQVDFIRADLAYMRFVPELLAELDVEEPWLIRVPSTIGSISALNFVYRIFVWTVLPVRLSRPVEN